MIELVEENNLPKQKSYNSLAYIHSGYLTIILAARQETNGTKDEQDPRT